MSFLFVVAGIALMSIVLLDAFQSIILPRRPVGKLRITRLFYNFSWHPWRWIASRLRSRTARDQFYSVYGPLSLLLLFFVWALLLTSGFGLVFYGLHVPFHDPMLSGSGDLARLRSCLYVSGTTIFTLGLGDVIPQSQVARLFTVAESGTGLGFIALRGLLTAGDPGRPAGRTCRIAADRHRAAGAAQLRGWTANPAAAAGGVGAMERGDAGDAHLLSYSLLLQVPAR